MSDTIELTVYLERLQDMSIGVYEHKPEFGDNQELIWIPTSQIVDDDITEIYKLITIEIPEWLATEKGLV